ncbi:PTS system beta-glucoside-specific EIIBCA component [Tetragenococcus halophilus subsp. flandriensis]|uniref:glucose PTS transporter subunit IIA n=1 Tax=Tetragenococcus halophilus TaxID=51669 RepID=UPI0023E9129C|nr:glucose PTS transporter subunit IIA [Tetragenococcus halophilus]GMA09341.1 PTS system beta-glucoside-specific EIIBCA component [Tetragenococcus halophilus subsp. flandriensis]
MTKKEISKKILNYIGSTKNVNNINYCMTRLRIDLNDNDLVELDKITDLDGILGAQFQNGQLQIIIGPSVSQYYNEIMEEVGETSFTDDSDSEKKGFFSRLLGILSGIFVPIIPAIAGAGMIKGIIAIIDTLNLVSTESDTFELISMMADCVFYFLPFLLAFSAAKMFKTSQVLAIVLAAALMHPTILQTAELSEVTSMEFFGLPIPVISYASSVVPIVLSVWVLKYVYNFVDNHMPEVMKVIFTPTVVLLIMIPFELIVTGPLGNYFGVALSRIVVSLFGYSGLLAGAILGGTRPIFVMTGMHQAFTPIFFQNFAEQGYDVLLPTFLLSTFAQATATFVMIFKANSKKDKSIAASASFSAILGISEPALYGVLVKYKRALIAACIGGAVGSAYVSMMQFHLLSFATSSIVSLPVYAASPDFIHFIIASIITVVATFILTLFLEKKRVTTDETEEIYTPLRGEMKELVDVPDSTFSSGAMGEGFAIIPEEGVVYAPFDGEVVTIALAKHALGLKSINGTEVLIHIGLETMKLNGEHFNILVDENQEFEKGQKLMTFDYDVLKEEFNMITPVIVMNKTVRINNKVKNTETNQVLATV